MKESKSHLLPADPGPRLPSRDRDFDQLFPAWARAQSGRHFTPVAVAKRAAALLVTRPGARILDAGSGIGKFCIVGALSTPGEFTGVEQRGHLVQAAREVARRYGVPRCEFLCQNLTEIDWRGYEGIYLFNPFAEHLPWHRPLDQTIKIDRANYDRYVQLVEERLGEASAGTRVVTYHGFGGLFPPGWYLMASLPVRGDHLHLWVKEGRGRRPRSQPG